MDASNDYFKPIEDICTDPVRAKVLVGVLAAVKHVESQDTGDLCRCIDIKSLITKRCGCEQINEALDDLGSLKDC